MKKQLTVKGKLRQRNLFEDEKSLFEKLCDPVKLKAGFKAVKKNGGSPGIDGVAIKEFEKRLEEELAQLQMELESWCYEPNPVLRVEIPKPEKGAGVRLLGVPCTRDRVVHATIKLLLNRYLIQTYQITVMGFAQAITNARPWNLHSEL